MQVRFKDDDLARLESDARFNAGHALAVVTAFRKTMQRIRAATDERDLRTNATRFEKLAGPRRHQCSMRLNDQFRLIIQLEGEAAAKTVAVIDIEDYH
ncbi:MAG: type II toxin-antitoxin system RelE/ParE family toxin [Chloroflexota bacterium]|nr:type II toxin-antitoxin system RelE/ParE family toxin [Chloroflexota bacterium]